MAAAAQRWLGRAAVPPQVSPEAIAPELRLRNPYRGIVTGQAILRLRVAIAPRGLSPREVVIDVDDVAVEVRSTPAPVVVDAGAIAALFVVERQPLHGFLTWFGVCARRRGRTDVCLIETPDAPVARFVERAIEERLGLGDEPVRGELRVAP